MHTETRSWTLLVICLGYTAAQFVNLSSSVEQSGRSHACPDENVTYTCETNGTTLTWLVDPYVTLNNYIHTFSRISTNEELIATVPEAVRLLVSNSPTLLSTMVLTPSGNVENTTVVCLTSNGISRSLPYRMSGLPSPPQNVMVTIVQNGTTTVTVNIDWDPPVNNGGGAVDSYTLETSPETDTVRVTSGTTARLDLFYNVRRVVSVTAVNCAGSSTPAMTDPVEFVNCSTPSTNPNVTFDPYQSTTEGSVISYQCRPGFIPEGRVMSVCGVNGSWVPDPDQYNCRQVNCGAPRLPVNSSVLSVPSNGVRNGSEVTFQCNERLFPSNEITIVCTSEERWSPDPERIVCGEQPDNCTHPNMPRNGFLDEVTSTTLMFGCNEGYFPQGSMIAECVAIDIWSPDPARLECTTTTPPTKVVNCGAPKPPVNGMVTNITSTLEGSEVTFQCNTLTAICNRDGRWSPTPGQQVCGYNSGASSKNQVITGVVCSVVFYIGGVVSTILIYLAITRCKETRKQVAITSSGRSEAPNTAAPVYDDIPGVVPMKAGIELQENVAYGPVIK